MPDRDVLGRRIDARQKIHVVVQVPAVDLADDGLVDGLLQVPEVHEVARLPVDLAFDGHLQAVGVPVAVRVVALVEDATVPSLVPVLAVQPVRRGEMGVGNQPNAHRRDSSAAFGV